MATVDGQRPLEHGGHPVGARPANHRGHLVVGHPKRPLAFDDDAQDLVTRRSDPDGGHRATDRRPHRSFDGHTGQWPICRLYDVTQPSEVDQQIILDVADIAGAVEPEPVVPRPGIGIG